MILPSLTEEKIRAELDYDHRWVMSYAKKKTKRLTEKIRDTDLIKKTYKYEYRITSPNNNHWYLCININLLRKKKVQLSCNCVVESSHGNLDYYLMRGYTFGGIYFVRITSHAISRLKTRNPQCANLDGQQICSLIFKPGEEGSGMKFTDHHFIRFIEKADDSTDVCILLTTEIGVFFTYQSLGKNCIIKTYISHDMISDGLEREIYDYCNAGYVFLNQSKCQFPQELIDNSLQTMMKYRSKYDIAQCGFCFPE